MSTIVKNIHILKDGVWRPISKVFHQGEWKKMKGIFYDGEWYEIGTTCTVMPEGCAISTSIHPRWDEHSTYYSTNNLKFNWLPSGIQTGIIGFRYIGNLGSLWLSTENITDTAYSFAVGYNFGGIEFLNSSNPKISGFGVRCVKTYNGELETGSILVNDYKDGGGNYYDSVVIGKQLWTTKNLHTTKYQNGNDIQNITSNTDWFNLTSGAYCWYDNDYDTYGQHYGALYNWYAVDNGLVDYNGYRVSSKEDWEQLIEYLTTTNWCHGVSVTNSNIAQFLKSCRQVNHPLAPNTFVYAGVFSVENSIVGLPPVDYFKINNTTYQTSEEDYEFKYNYKAGDVITRLQVNTGLRIFDGNGTIIYWDQEFPSIVGPAYTIKSSDLTTGIKVEIMSYPT